MWVDSMVWCRMNGLAMKRKMTKLKSMTRWRRDDDEMTTRWWRDDDEMMSKWRDDDMTRWRDNHQEAFALFTRSSDEDGNEITTDELGKVGFLSFFAIDFYLFLFAQTLQLKPFFCSSSCLYFLLLLFKVYAMLVYMKCFSLFLLPLFVCL